MSKPSMITKFVDEELKVLEIKGQKDDTILDHKVSLPAILSCRAGKVIYNQSEIKQILEQDDFKLIPADQIHNVVFETESTLELILFSEAKLRFIKV